MRTTTLLAVAALTGTAAVNSCGAPPNPSAFAAYWHQGTAEITTYALEQARYGEIHSGNAVLIYVTEDFSGSKHVKLDRPERAASDRVPILKLNFTKNFTTGVYPYSMMTSIFAPVAQGDDPSALKITTSSQEWCGHTFVQMDQADGDTAGYRVQQHSYFESEGEKALTLEQGIPEDALWTTIRLNPSDLPVGEVQLIPGTMYTRLRHQPWQVHTANASLEAAAGADADGVMVYTLEYPALERTLAIRFQKAFPHEVEGWEETYVSGFGAGAERLTTRAAKVERTQMDYWNKHDVADGPLRGELGLP